MTRWIIVGTAAFIGFAIVLAPPHLVTDLATQSTDRRVLISSPTGSVWAGRGELSLRLSENRPPVGLGTIAWRFYPAGISTLGVDWRLDGPTHRLVGELVLGNDLAVTLEGRMDAEFVNPFLAPYHINLSGDFELDDIAAEIIDNDIAALSGLLRWSGGDVVYRLSGETNEIVLAPLVARANETPDGVSIVATTNDSETPMINARLDKAGWLHVGISRHFLDSVGQPWRGDAAADAMVVEVSEKIL